MAALDLIAQSEQRLPALLIIDGLDEIFEPQRRRFMAERIVGLATVARHKRLGRSRTAIYTQAEEVPLTFAEEISSRFQALDGADWGAAGQGGFQDGGSIQP